MGNVRRPSQTGICVTSCPTATVTATVQPTEGPLECVPYLCLRLPCKKATVTATYPATCPPAPTVTTTVTASCVGCNACSTKTVSVAGTCTTALAISSMPTISAHWDINLVLGKVFFIFFFASFHVFVLLGGLFPGGIFTEFWCL